MEQYILAIDQGTTSSRVMIFDHDSREVARAQTPITQYYPASGWVEHDADQIWQTVVDCLENARREAALEWSDIAAIGITNQRETIVVWDRFTGEPVGHAICWQCRRTQDRCEALKAKGLTEPIRERTGLEIDAYFSATKLAWILDEYPDARERARRGDLLAGTIDSWLIWKLTAGDVHATDVSNAARTMLYNIHETRWDPWLLEPLDIPAEMMPRVVPSSGIVGYLSTDILGEEARESRIPISGIAGDQQASLFGQGCFEPGMVKNTYGTGGFILMQTGSEAIASENRLITTVAWQREGKDMHYALEGSVFNSGSTIQWLRDELGLISRSRDVDILAAQVPDSGGMVVVPSFTGLGAPYWDMGARGAIVGLSRGSNRAQLCRAVLESIAFQSADVCLAMAADSGQPLRTLRVDGGASVSDLMLQYQADLLNITIERPKTIETTALGAAYLAGLGIGYWDSLNAVREAWQLDRRFLPKHDAHWRAAEMERWDIAVKTVQEHSRLNQAAKSAKHE